MVGDLQFALSVIFFSSFFVLFLLGLKSYGFIRIFSPLLPYPGYFPKRRSMYSHSSSKKFDNNCIDWSEKLAIEATHKSYSQLLVQDRAAECLVEKNFPTVIADLVCQYLSEWDCVIQDTPETYRKSLLAGI